MSEWQVHYNLESSNYLEENGPYIYDLFADMEAIPSTFGDPAVIHISMMPASILLYYTIILLLITATMMNRL